MENKKDINIIDNAKKQYSKDTMNEVQIQNMKKQIEQAKIDKRRDERKRMIKGMIVVAASVGIFILLPNTSGKVAYAMSNIPIIGRLVDVVTFRNYEYESERNNADIKIPELVVQDVEESSDANENVQEALQETTEKINADIQKITDQIVKEFEDSLSFEEGYQDVMVSHEILKTTPNYFTLKLICYQGSGSGAQWNYYYTIDLTTGKQMKLKDLFRQGTDFITPISENIKTQMREQMKADDMKYYWVDDEIEEMNFKEITEDTSFYVNENGEIVISFDEYEVAPGYMGCVDFTIPNEIVREIRN